MGQLESLKELDIAQSTRVKKKKKKKIIAFVAVYALVSSSDRDSNEF
jgi:hypothetical protein